MRTHKALLGAGARWTASAALALAMLATGCLTDTGDIGAAEDSDISAASDRDRLSDGDLGSDELAATAALTPTFHVTLVPNTGISGVQRVNFAVPLPAGRVTDPNLI